MTPKQSYKLTSNGLGDAWAGVNWCFLQSIAQGKPVRLSNRKGNYDQENWREGRVAEIIALYDTSEYPDAAIEVTGPDVPVLSIPRQLWQYKYFPTKRVWQPSCSRRVLLHFTPFTVRKYAPSEVDQLQVIKVLQGLDFEPVVFEGNETLEEVVNMMSESCAVISMCSGFTHVCHSVGTPLYIVDNGVGKVWIDRHHGRKKFTHCENFFDAAQKLYIGE